MTSESSTSKARAKPPKPMTYRVLGIPLDWDRAGLDSFLVSRYKDAKLKAQSLAIAHHDEFQTATVDSLDGTSLCPDLSDASDLALQADHDFLGVTTLFRPPREDHEIDVIAVCGLGGHAYGSYRNKSDHHMWLRDALPKSMTAEQSKRPMARIMTYGYKSPVKDSNSMQSLEDLATSFRQSLSALESHKPLVLIGHSLGGLIIKQALIAMHKSQKKEHKRVLQTIYGIAFFGVPHHGMDMTELIAMSELGPNLGLLTSLSHLNSPVLDMQKREFHPALGKKGEREVVCFYETLASPTAKQLDNGDWEISGPEKVLVTKPSATHGREWESGEEHICALSATHSDLVKFGLYGSQKGIVLNTLRDLGRRALNVQDRFQDPSVKFIVPYPANECFVGRESILQEIIARLELDKTPSERRCRKLSLYGLGGIGKTQIAISFAYWVKRHHRSISVLWVHASNKNRFRQAYEEFAQEFDIPGRDDPETDILKLVCGFLEKQDGIQWIMIIDNADDRELFFPPSASEGSTNSDPQESKGLGQYIPKCNQGSVLLTTRNSKAGVDHMSGKAPLEVGKLSDTEALQLIHQLGNDQATPAEALKLSRQLEHLPLAIAQAVSFMTENSASVERYCRIHEESDSAFVDQLSQDFQAEGRDKESVNAVAKTWMVSFHDIQRRDPLASEFLSFMSLFDRQGIPEKFVAQYQRLAKHQVTTPTAVSRRSTKPSPGASKSLRSRLGSLFLTGRTKRLSKKLDHREDRTLSRLEDADSIESEGAQFDMIQSLGTLIAYSFITQTTDGSYDMHRLVQLVTRKWLLKEEKLCTFRPQAISVLCHAYPSVGYDTLDEIMRLLPHTNAILAHDVAEKDETKQTKLKRGHILILTGGYFHFKSQYGEAEQFVQQAYRILNAAFGAENEDTLEAISILLEVYIGQGRWAEGIKFGEESQRRCDQSLGKEHWVTLRFKKSLAWLYRQQDRLEEAEDLLRVVIETEKKKWGDKDKNTLDSMAVLALVYQEQGRLHEAEKLQLEVSGVREDVYGKEHPRTLNSLHNLATIYVDQNRFKEADDLLKTVLEKESRMFGSEDDKTLTTMHNLASNYYCRGNIEQAQSLGRQVWQSQLRKFGENQPHTLYCMHNYAFILKKMERTQEAIDLMRDCWTRKGHVFGATHPNTLMSKKWLHLWEAGSRNGSA